MKLLELDNICEMVLPVPPAPPLIVVPLVAVQENVDRPVVEVVSGIFTVLPLHTEAVVADVSTGAGFTVTITVEDVPLHPAADVGITV